MIVETILTDTGDTNIIRPNPTIPHGNGYRSSVARNAALAWNVIRRSVEPGRAVSAIDRLVLDACLDAVKQERTREDKP